VHTLRHDSGPSQFLPHLSAAITIGASEVIGVRVLESALRIASTPEEFAAARQLFEEYAQQLGIDLCFQNFPAELEQLPDMYGPPSGCLLLAYRDGGVVGCAGLRRWSEEICEMKRLYVRLSARGCDLGRRLAAGLIERARPLGYNRMYLDTLAQMSVARKLYRSLGFRETAAYYINPVPGVLYMEREL
jgi:putative acetyltransferase